ncbi:MAG: PIN domain-containing protein, partial [bacterium]
MKSKFLIIDGNALIHRGFHAMPNLRSPSGEPTGAIFGFASILLKAIVDLKPKYVVSTFDLRGPTFRHKKFAGYKAKRVKAPDELYEQIPRVKEV